MKSEDRIRNLISESNLTINSQTDKRILGDAIECLGYTKQKELVKTRHKIWKTIMKDKITRLGAAAIIIIAVFIAVNPFSNSIEKVAFADVVKPILTARTATYKTTLKIPKMILKIPNKTGSGFDTIEFKTIKCECMFVEPGRIREIAPRGHIKIVDYQQSKMLKLNTEEKTATVFELKDIPDEEKSRSNIFREMRKRIKKAQQKEDESVELLGKQKIEGQTAIGYHVRDAGEDIIIWANAETLLPVRMEYSMTKIMGEESSYIISDIAFDVELDESLFSLEVPEGYTIETKQMVTSYPKEKDLIGAFRLWTESISNKFPSDLKMKTVVAELNKAFLKKEELKNKGSKFKYGLAFEKVAYGFTFAHLLPESSDWHYAGEDVKLGDGDTAIFWYRPEGSQTYHVIYGDLSIKDVAPENLPK